jgi:hypothetical protein
MSDINPPDWRGNANSTFQHREFSIAPWAEEYLDTDNNTFTIGHFWPETKNNAYATPTTVQVRVHGLSPALTIRSETNAYHE